VFAFLGCPTTECASLCGRLQDRAPSLRQSTPLNRTRLLPRRKEREGNERDEEPWPRAAPGNDAKVKRKGLVLLNLHG
jgi:hypothetical protein